MSASESLQPRQFDNQARLSAFTTAKSRPGTEVFWGSPTGRYVANPLASHIPPPVREDHGDGSYTTHPQHGIPAYSKYASVQRPTRVEHLPLDCLESTQPDVNRTHVNNMTRRKGTPPPIEVDHHTDSDRYVISEGNHRVVSALKRGNTHIPAVVTRITQASR